MSTAGGTFGYCSPTRVQSAVLGAVFVQLAATADAEAESTVGSAGRRGYHAAAGAPAIAADARLCGDVFKLEVSFVEIEGVGMRIAGKEHVFKPIVVHIANAYARTVVKVLAM